MRVQRGLMTGLVIAGLIIGLVKIESAEAALIDQVNAAFRQVHSRTPTFSEWEYWAGRVERREKTTYAALVGAIAFQKAESGGSPAGAASALHVDPAGGFAIDRNFYPNPVNPNFLPEGTLISSPSTSNVYYVTRGKKSWVLPRILNVWLRENHFFKSNIIITVTDADLARYPTASSVNKLYIGKILQHPNGAQFWIDDKLRKRQISAAIRGALRTPGGNTYPTTAAHLAEFNTGPALQNADKFPGGAAFYDGPYHGGRIWKTEERSDGTITKHLYLKDRFYEADGYPDESQRAPIDATKLARHPRGLNVDRYPEGWVVAIGNDIYLMQGGKLRLITSPQILGAMGYGEQHIRREFPDLYQKLPKGNPIRAFKNIVVGGAAASKGAPAPAPSTATHLTRVRPEIRTLISQMNSLYISVFDKDPTPADNAFWVDYVYQGEVNNKADLLEKMRQARATGENPARISRTAQISLDSLKRHWLPYLFYFTHQKEMSSADRAYWESRVKTGDRDSIFKLGSTIQWLSDTHGLTSR